MAPGACCIPAKVLSRKFFPVLVLTKRQCSQLRTVVSPKSNAVKHVTCISGNKQCNHKARVAASSRNGAATYYYMTKNKILPRNFVYIIAVTSPSSAAK